MSESEIVKDFLVESYENLDRLDRDLVGLEKNPQDQAALAGVFRTIHTIKGTCGFLGYNKLEKVAHVGENLLTRLRDGQLTLNPERTTALLGMVDAVRQMLKEIESTGQDGEIDYPELRETLTRLQTPVAGDAGEAPGQTVEVATPAEVGPQKTEEVTVSSAKRRMMQRRRRKSSRQRQPNRRSLVRRPTKRHENLRRERLAAYCSCRIWLKGRTRMMGWAGQQEFSRLDDDQQRSSDDRQR